MFAKSLELNQRPKNKDLSCTLRQTNARTFKFRLNETVKVSKYRVFKAVLLLQCSWTR